jgi:hypothetical protein
MLSGKMIGIHVAGREYPMIQSIAKSDYKGWTGSSYHN